ncbi:hypothetical protein [Ruminococcus champanellensis]|uniref:hypothetical protein n=1 Tax=Ruminococcus champanellensis TaxID=1161942 RepID=UPI002E774B5F|nr:hypothetical protein [Ruminococcus champanellensis]
MDDGTAIVKGDQSGHGNVSIFADQPKHLDFSRDVLHLVPHHLDIRIGTHLQHKPAL